MWVKSRLDWRSLSGYEMFLILYDVYAANVPAARLRQFYTQSEDWTALRALDAGSLNDDGGGA